MVNNEVTNDNENKIIYILFFLVVFLAVIFGFTIVAITEICDSIGDEQRIVPSIILLILTVIFFIMKTNKK